MNTKVVSHDFSQALNHLRCGLPIRRRCWPEGHAVILVWENGSKDQVLRRVQNGGMVHYVAPSQDLLATDWELIEKKGG